MKVLSYIACLFLSACTFNVTTSMAHTEGTATDTIEDTQSPVVTPTVSPNINIPVKPL